MEIIRYVPFNQIFNYLINFNLKKIFSQQDNSADEKHVQFGKKKASVVTPPNLSYDEQPNDNLHERKRRKRFVVPFTDKQQ